MTAGWRIRFASILCLLGLAEAPALAQDQAAAPATEAPAPAAPPAEAVIGPPQLENFSLNGTVTRRAAPPTAQPQQPAQPSRAEAAPPATAQPRQVASAEPQRPQPSRGQAETPVGAQPRRSQSRLPFSLGLDSPPTRASTEAGAFAPAFDPSPADSVDPLPTEDGSGGLPWPWILAFAALAGAVGWHFLRQRSRLAYAGGVSELVTVEPRPEPARPVPAPPRPAGPTPATGIVSTRLRPWLDIAFTPEGCRLTDDGATLDFAVTVTNSGGAPARDLLIEAVMVNAGSAQDKELGAFFSRPVGQGDRIEGIAPLKSLALRHSVSLTREQLRMYQAGGRTMFVPIVAFNALYRHGGGDAQTSAAWLVGRRGTGEKMAPFHADKAPRAFAGLAARQLEQRVRN